MSDGGKIIDFASAKEQIQGRSLLERRRLHKLRKQHDDRRERELLQTKEKTRESIEYLWDLVEDSMVLGAPETWDEDAIQVVTHLRSHLTCIAETYLGDESPFKWVIDAEEEQPED